MAGVEGHGDERHGFGQADESERERIAGQLVDLPADDEALHLDGDGQEEPEAGEEPVIADLQGGEGVVLPGSGRSLEMRPVFLDEIRNAGPS